MYKFVHEDDFEILITPLDQTLIMKNCIIGQDFQNFIHSTLLLLYLIFPDTDTVYDPPPPDVIHWQKRLSSAF